MTKPWVATTEDEAKEQGMRHRHMRKAIRMSRHPEMFIGLTDALVNMSIFQPTKELQLRFNDVFDRDQRENLKIILHPLMKRWTIFEKVHHKGQKLWRPVCMFRGDSKEDYLPEDLQRSDNMLEHLRGSIGDFRDVTYQDLEFVEKCDMRKYGWESVHTFLEGFDLAEEKERNRIFEDQIDDFLDHSFWAAMQDSQAHYSKPWSTRDVELKSSPDRYKTETITGASGNPIKVRTKIYGEEGDINEMKILSESAKMREEYYTTASGRAANRILEIKNRNYLARHGVTLWERATGRKPGDSKIVALEGDSVAQDAENKTQVLELMKMIAEAPVPTEKTQSVEDWLLDLAKEKAPV